MSKGDLWLLFGIAHSDVDLLNVVISYERAR
jgi:hypothetical protein